MEISKINNLEFNGIRKNNKKRNVKSISPKHINKNAIIMLGLVASGTIIAATLIKKNKINLFDTAKKANPLNFNPKTKEAISNNINDKTTQTVQVVEQEPEKIVETVENNLAKIEEVQPQKATETIEEIETNVVKADNEKAVQEISKETTETAEETTEKLTEEVPAEEPITDSEENALKKSQLAQRRTNLIRKNYKKNHLFIKGNMKKYPKLFKDFGVDDEILEKFLHLNNKTVREINDSEFLSLLLAPSNKLSLTFDEVSRKNPPYGNKFIEVLENTLLSGTKKAKRDKILDRKFRLHNVVSDVLSTKGRIKKLGEMRKTFSHDDISKIFNADSPEPKNMLLSWLLEFHVKAKDDYLLEKLHEFVK